MSQELTVQDDGFDVRERSGAFIIGGMIKFNKIYTLNKTEQLPPDLTLLVIAIITCWVRWWDHAPTEHRVTHSGQLHPQREDLPDQDKTLWEIGLDSISPADPWKDTRYMHLINLQTGQDYTFVTDTNGGRMAIGELKSSIRNVRIAHPTATPIIKFGSTTFKSPKFGLVARPLFIVDGWHQGFKEAAPAQGEQQLLAPATLPTKTLAEELDDAIPDFENENVESPKAAAPPLPNARRDLKKPPAKTGAKKPPHKRSILDAG
jgi:hypothetical protein